MYTCSTAYFFNLLSYIQVLPSCFNISDIVYMFCRLLSQSFFLYTGSAILFLTPLTKYTCSAAPFFNILSYIQVLQSCFTIFKQYPCSAAPFFQSFFLYTGSAILFYHLLNSIHDPPPPFFNLFSYIQVLPSCFTIL